MSLRFPQSYSFTLKSDAGKFREIVSKVGISVPFTESGGVRGEFLMSNMIKRLKHAFSPFHTS